MRAYIIRRLLLVIPTLFGVTIITFLLLRFIPGDIVDQMLMRAEFGQMAGTAIARDNILRALGLDAPLYIQYFRWLGAVPLADGSFSGLFQGDLGNSVWRGVPVAGLILDRLPISIELASLSFVIMAGVALPIGIYSAIRQDTVGDYAARSFATALIALPGFWVGLMFLLAASLWLGYSPPLGAISFTQDPIGHLKQFIPPAFVMAMGGVGATMRMMRSMLLEVLRQDYIRMAWAKGLSEGAVITRHAFKNALIPVVTMAGLLLPALVGGTVIIETVFNLPGTGRLMITALSDRDYPIVSGIVLITAVVLVISNLIVDLSYAYLDPRVRYK